jgi:hypothetical protein
MAILRTRSLNLGMTQGDGKRKRRRLHMHGWSMVGLVDLGIGVTHQSVGSPH